jgi:hypothetical protein
MLYHLFTYLREHFSLPGAGVFYFITFRTAMAIVLSLVISLVYGKRMIQYLHRKQIGETVRDLGLEGEKQKKGTPTMGGIIIIAAILIPTLLFARIENVYILLMIISTIWLGLIGFIDDYIKVFKKNKEGLKGRFKIIGQIGVGLIVIVKLIGVPTQLFNVGVTDIVPVIGAALLFVPVNEAIFPVPLAPKPIAVLEFVQLVVAPTGVEVKLTTGVAPPHCEIFVTAVKTGLGLIVIVKVIGVPAHPAAVGVTVIVATKSVEPVFVPVKAGKFPVLLAAKPIAVFEFVQA